MITQPLRNWIVIRRQKVFVAVQMVCLDPDYQDTLSLLCDLAAHVCNDSIVKSSSFTPNTFSWQHWILLVFAIRVNYSAGEA